MTNNEKTAFPENSDPHAWNGQLLRDPHAVADKRKRVQNMFAAIAPSYDLNNRLHSLWMDQAWRRKAVKLAELKPTDRVVDVACGTGDLAHKFAQRLEGWANPDYATADGQVIGIDFTYQMLPLARQKWTNGPAAREYDHMPDVRRQVVSMVRWINGDAQAIPLPGHTANVVSIAFGIRNVQHPETALAEFRRVLRPGGRLIILEFSLPTNPILRALYNFYFHQVLPRTATLISGDKTGAYKYLPKSVNTFIGREQMMAMMRSAGFEQVEQFPMTFGVCVCYRGLVPLAAEAASPVGVHPAGV
jgi:demethylmenaquinone methyltransferase/2-methoxy-6-polyprenyl-1,4-benzoquinol methylase